MKSLDYTIAKAGESFSYFYEVYMAKEQEDIENTVSGFVPNFKPSFSI